MTGEPKRKTAAVCGESGRGLTLAAIEKWALNLGRGNASSCPIPVIAQRLPRPLGTGGSRDTNGTKFRRTIDDCEVSEVAPVNDIPYHEHPPRRGAECA